MTKKETVKKPFYNRLRYGRIWSAVVVVYALDISKNGRRTDRAVSRPVPVLWAVSRPVSRQPSCACPVGCQPSCEHNKNGRRFCRPSLCGFLWFSWSWLLVVAVVVVACGCRGRGFRGCRGGRVVVVVWSWFSRQS